MAGRPKTRATLEALQERALKELGEGATALEYVTHVLGSGGRIIDVGEALAKPKGPLAFTPGYGMVQSALEMETGKGGEVQAALSAARRQGAHAKVEEAEQIADTVSADRDQVARAKLKAEIRTWAAARANREAYGDQKSGGIEINIGELHLGALQRSQINGPPRVLPTLVLQEAPVDADVLVVDRIPSDSGKEVGAERPALHRPRPHDSV